MGDLKTVEDNLLKVQTNIENNLSVVVEKQATSSELKNIIATGVNVTDPMIKVSEVARLIGIHGTEFVKHVPEVWGVPDDQQYVFVVGESQIEDYMDKTNIDNVMYYMHPKIPVGKSLIELFGDRDNGTYKAISYAYTQIDGVYPDYKLRAVSYQWPPESGTEKNIVATKVSKDGIMYLLGSGVNKM